MAERRRVLVAEWRSTVAALVWAEPNADGEKRARSHAGGNGKLKTKKVKNVYNNK